MKKVFAGSLLAFSVLALSCGKKDKDKDTSVSGMLQGKWYMTDSHWIHYFNGNVIPDSATYNKGDYIVEFKGNQLNAQNSSGNYSTTFKIIDGPKIVTADNDTTDITKLTESILSIHYIDRSIPGNVYDQTDNYKKY